MGEMAARPAGPEAPSNGAPLPMLMPAPNPSDAGPTGGPSSGGSGGDSEGGGGASLGGGIFGAGCSRSSMYGGGGAQAGGSWSTVSALFVWPGKDGEDAGGDPCSGAGDGGGGGSNGGGGGGGALVGGSLRELWAAVAEGLGDAAAPESPSCGAGGAIDGGGGIGVVLTMPASVPGPPTGGCGLGGLPRGGEGRGGCGGA